jgi:hypothetical protein
MDIKMEYVWQWLVGISVGLQGQFAKSFGGLREYDTDDILGTYFR